MKKPAALLSLIQRYPPLFSWICIYLLFWVASSAHQTAFVAMLLTNITIIPMIGAWAFVNYFLAPRALHNHRALFYFVCLIILIVVPVISTELDLQLVGSLIERHMFRYSPEVEAAIQRGESQRNWLHGKYVVLLLTTIAITTISWLLNERERLNQLQRESRTILELKYLRAQVNPHFLFNALNCIYSLSLAQDSRASDSIIKLSEMLRYMSDDCRYERVPLQKEVSYIRNYIDFQLIRMEQEPDITFDCQIDNPSCKVPPLLFQPMVENCFKHSQLVSQPKGFIHITLQQDEKQLLFTAENSIPPTQNQNEERTGIGLANVRQRLQLLFGHKAYLNVTPTDNTYRIELCITYS